MKKAYSFDVFDTVLVRIWAKPTDLFWELGHFLQQESLITISAESWSHLRTKTEGIVRRHSPQEEVTLRQIYAALAENLNWSEADTQTAIEKEIELELDSLQPVPIIQAKIQALHQQNEQVIFISDMYLPQKVIKLFLQEKGIWSEGDILFVSSELGITKSSGRLFRHCLKTQSLFASELYHIGDNLHSDVKVPRRMGIKVQPFTQTHLNRYEQQIANNQKLPLKFRSLLAGSSRLTRLQCQEQTSNQQAIWDTVASVIGPVLVGFVHWCLQTATSRGLKRLYFVARDGQILVQIAQILQQNWKYGLDCRYLYGSRQAWHFPTIKSIGESELNWIFDPAIFLSVRAICERVNLKPEQIKSILENNGFPEISWEKNLSSKELTRLRGLFQQTLVAELILATAQNYYTKTIGYFQQEGLTDNVPFGIVDLGWRGSLQKALSHLLTTAYMYPENGIDGFYFALKQRSSVQSGDRLLAYFFDVADPSPRLAQLCNFPGFVDLLEAFVAADHGSTVRFEQKQGKYIPILRNTHNQLASNWGLETLQKSVLTLTKNFSAVSEQEQCSSDLFLVTTEPLLQTLVKNPTKAEAEAFGSLKVTSDMVEARFYELAPKLTFALFWRMLYFQQNSSSLGWRPTFIWKPGIIARSNLIPGLIYQSLRILSARR